MAEFALVQATSRTSAGTQDFTSSGFGTPKGILVMVTAGLVNGTVANHGLMCIGAADGTRNIVTSMRSKDGIALGTTATARRARNSTDCLLFCDQDGNVLLQAQWSAWITDGVRLNFSVATGGAYLVTVLLIGGAGVSDVYTSTVTSPGVVDTATDVTGPGFEPSMLLTFSNGGDGAWDNTTDAQDIITFGFVQNAGSNPHPQYSMNYLDINAVAT